MKNNRLKLGFLIVVAVLLVGCQTQKVEKKASYSLDGIWFNTTLHNVMKIDLENEKYYLTTNPEFHELGEEAFVYGHHLYIDEAKKEFSQAGHPEIVYQYKLSKDGNVSTVKQKWSSWRYVRFGSEEAQAYAEVDSDLELADVK